MDTLRAVADRRTRGVEDVQHLIEQMRSELGKRAAAGGAIVEMPGAATSGAAHVEPVGRHHALDWPKDVVANERPRGRRRLRIPPNLSDPDLQAARPRVVDERLMIGCRQRKWFFTEHVPSARE